MIQVRIRHFLKMRFITLIDMHVIVEFVMVILCHVEDKELELC